MWATDEPTLGPPVIAGNAAIAYVGSASRLELVAWSLDDGSELWRHEARPGFAPTGFRITPAAVDVAAGGVAAFLTVGPTQQDGSAYHAVAIVDVATGLLGLAGLGAPVVPDRRPEPCEDGISFCFEGRDPQTLEAGTYRVDAVTGLVDWTASSTGGFEIGAGLRITRGGDLVLEDQTWTSSYDAVFGPGYSTAFGWHWVADDETGYLIGSAGRFGDGSEFADPDLTSDITVGLDPESGRVVWKQRSVNTGCAAADDHADVWCRVLDGRWDVASDPADPTFVDLTVAVEGFDPATGETRWSVVVDDPQAAMWGTRGERFASTEGFVHLDGVDGVVRVSTQTGVVTPVTTEESLVCLTGTELALIVRGESHVYRGESLARHCDRDRVGLAGPLPRAFAESLGTAVEDGGFVVAQTDGLHFYR